jgi:hypothetical protein
MPPKINSLGDWQAVFIRDFGKLNCTAENAERDFSLGGTIL